MPRRSNASWLRCRWAIIQSWLKHDRRCSDRLVNRTIRRWVELAAASRLPASTFNTSRSMMPKAASIGALRIVLPQIETVASYPPFPPTPSAPGGGPWYVALPRISFDARSPSVWRKGAGNVGISPLET